MYLILVINFYINQFFSFTTIVIINFFIRYCSMLLTIYVYDLIFMVVIIKILDIQQSSSHIITI